MYKQVQRPQHRFVGQKTTGRGRDETKHAGVKKLSSFIWTFMVSTENGKRNINGWVSSTGPHLQENVFYINILGKRSENVR